MIMDRETLMDSYIEAIIDGMDHKSMYHYVRDNLMDHHSQNSSMKPRSIILNF